MAERRKRRPVEPPPLPAYPKVIETYGEPASYTIDRMTSSEPWAGNGYVQIERYRITVERIEEPREVLIERLRMLWRTSEPNHHSWDPMRAKARELGLSRAEIDELLPLNTQGCEYRR